MNVEEYRLHTKGTSQYIEVPVSAMEFYGNYARIMTSDIKLDGLVVAEDMRDSICRYVGVSPALNRDLYATDPTLWKTVLDKLYSAHGNDKIIILIESLPSCKYIKGICTNPRPAISNSIFIDQVLNHFEDVGNTVIDSIEYAKDVVTSSVTVFGDTWYEGVSHPRFKLGVVFLNDETTNASCRMVLKFDNSELYYLPSKFYSASSSRYDKHTSNSVESLGMVLLKVSEDFLTGYIDKRAPEVIMYLDDSAKKVLSKAEYDATKTTLLNAARSSDMDEEEISDILTELSKIDDFEKLYGSIGSDYLWKSTALSENSLKIALAVVGRIPFDHQFYPECLPPIRDLLGEYLVKPRSCQYIAKRL